MFEDECNRLNFHNYEYIDADENDDLVTRYGIRNLPTLIFLENGEVVGRAFGVNAWQNVAEFINR